MFRDRFAIGVIHLPPLPYTYTRETPIEKLIEYSVRDARILEEAGFDGILIENFGDKPYQKRVTDPLALTAMAIAIHETAKSVSIPVGVNLLRNSGLEAYSIAIATRARFIRINAYVETLLTDSGIIEPETNNLRAVKLNYPGIKIFADILCKHGASLTYTNLLAIHGAEEALKIIILDAVERGGADYIVVTGGRTGEPPALELLKRISEISPTPIVIGSGTTPDNICKLIGYAHGVIVGSYIKIDGRAGNPVDIERAKRFIETLRSCR
ncbi:photosystem I assembly BtpA [Ignisphaera aggregans DSM 17230]|uniref:Photosystem I assembly BtpA n=1 Tax=Ignisphaera aggregans (strain DSM 17230 / JCM 13409 / AQ1.S1) TaxID=583356 RepID=E0STN3_IGNAA|nr:photosystem I assembly BtpA [Ignisphaera aggregans DSM 17230]